MGAEQALYAADSEGEGLGVGSMLTQQMQATVSLSTLLLLVVAAFAARQMYRCWAAMTAMSSCSRRLCTTSAQAISQCKRKSCTYASCAAPPQCNLGLFFSCLFYVCAQ